MTVDARPVDPALEADDQGAGSTRIAELVLAFALPINGLVLSLPAIVVPLNEAAAATLVALALTRPASTSIRQIPAAFPLLLAVPALLVLSAFVNRQHDVVRLGHLVVWAALILALASGRLHGRSVARGLTAGLVVGVAVSSQLIDESAYEGRLTGILGDPNTAGFFMLGCGFAAAMWLGTRGRWFLLSVVTVGTVLTLSRTTLAALAAGLVWVAVSRGRGRLAGVGAAAALMGVVAWLESNVSRVGPFQGRSGSDDLRRAIDLASQFKASIRPWIGLGPGTAQVEARSEQFFFHSSYLAVRTEGGWLTLCAVLALFAAVALAVMGARHRSAAWGVGGMLAVLVCAGSLGDVFLELPTAILIGMTAGCLLAREPGAPPDAEASTASESRTDSVAPAEPR